MKNILVLGKGYISTKIEKYWTLKDYRLVRVSRSEFDYTDIGVLTKLMNDNKPDFVINTYGFTGKPNVDSCQDMVDECLKVNVNKTTELLSRICLHFRVKCINVTTGCVYNDDNGRVFTENDPHNFGINNPTASVYSKTKSLLEKMIYQTDLYNNYLYMLCIRMPFDEVMDDKNYINKIIKYDKLINYPNSVTYVPDLVWFIQTIITEDVPSGIFNVVNKNPITADRVLDIYHNITGVNKVVDRWYSTDDLLSMGLMKCRRSNCVLSTEKIEKYYPRLLTSEEAVRDSIAVNKLLTDMGVNDD